MQPNAIAAVQKPSGYRTGLQAGLTIALGYVPIALTFGLLGKSTGLSFVETVAMSVIVFAGASQFLALNLIALGTGGLEIILATFMINLRQLLFSASINEKSSDSSFISKALYAFGITDETFTVAVTSGKDVTAPFMFGLETMAYGSWVVFSGVGFFVGAALPEILQESMGIALYAMFIGLLVPSLKKYRKIAVLAGLSAALNGILTLFMDTGWAIVSATLISAVAIEFLWKGREPE
jgi:4-azaleucine resistance transporter AzlC